MELAGARPRGDFDAPIAQLVIFRGEGILIDADFQDIRFGGKLAGGESINVNLAAIGSRRGARQCLQLRLQFIRVVRERLQILSLDHQGRGVFLGIDAHLGGLICDLYLFHFLRDLERDVNFSCRACGHLDILLRKPREAFGAGCNRIGSGGQAIDFVRSIRMNYARFDLSRGGYGGHLSTWHAGA